MKLARQLGAFMVFAGPLDWWCAARGQWHPVEIKNLEGKNRYTKLQKDFLGVCTQRNVPVWTWRTERDVFECLGV